MSLAVAVSAAAQDGASPGLQLQPRPKLEINKIVADKSIQTAEKFAILREERRYVSNMISELEQRLVGDLRQFDYLGAAVGASIPPPIRTTKEVLASRKNSIDNQQRSIEGQIQQISSNQSRSPDDDRRLDNLQERRSMLENEVMNLQMQIDQYDAEEAREKEYQAEQTRLEEERAKKIEEKKLVESELKDQRYYLNVLDDAISGLFLANYQENSFRLWVSATFAILVGLVIGGFFFIAFRERAVSVSIFSSDSGLQFVTLFSLIIAIILFGIINILEGKELSALLGGLSGYILGRTALGRALGREQSNSPAPQPGGSAPAPQPAGP